MKKLKLSLLTILLGVSSATYADIITDTVSNGSSKQSIQKNDDQINDDKIKNINLLDPNFNPADVFNVENKDQYKLNIRVAGRTDTIKPHTGSMQPSLITSLETSTEYYANIISNCRNGQAIFRKVLDDFEQKYQQNQSILDMALGQIAEGKYSDNNLLSVEMMLRSELEAYRCVYMNAAINIVEKQSYIDQINKNIETLQKRNYVLRNTFDSIRYLFLDINSDKIIKDRIF